MRRALTFLQSDKRIRIGIGAVLVAVLVLLGARSVYGLVPRSYTLSITGGDIVSNRHYLARILQSEAAKVDLTLVVRPEDSMLAELRDVSDGKIDLAFIQGGLSTVFPHVEHVATVTPEMVHLLVKPGISTMRDLRGHSVNVGPKDSGERDVALTITQFADYEENIDYVQTAWTPEQLLALPDAKMPDAIISVSSVPSYLAELLVRTRHYDVIEIPFPESLALRHGWAADGQILSYTYNLNPPVPATTIQTVAVNLHLVANDQADPDAVEKVLEVLYSPSVANQLRQKVDESRIAISSGYPVSKGMKAYLARNDSIFTLQTWNKITSTFGLVMSFGGMGIVVFKWFRGMGLDPITQDAEFQGYLKDVAQIEKSLSAMESEDKIDRAALKSLRDRLGQLRVTMLERFPQVTLSNGRLFDHCLEVTAIAQRSLDRLTTQARDEGAVSSGQGAS